MAGIVSYGAYIPYYRLNRAEISRAWRTAKQSGEKAVANYDEDSITMAVAAAIDCLNGVDINTVDGLYFASTTAPFEEKQSAAFIATVLGLKSEAATMDFSSSLRSGTNALRAAVDAVNSGTSENVLVCVSDMRPAYLAGSQEMNFGDGAAAVLIGKNGVIADITGSYTRFDEIQDVWRTEKDLFVRSGEERFIIEEGYNRVISETVSSALEKFALLPKDFAKLIIYSPNSRQLMPVVKLLQFETFQIVDNMSLLVGDTGTAQSLMNLVSALEEAKTSDRILLASYGNGCDVFSLRVTAEIEKIRNKRGVKKHLASKNVIDNYGRYLRWRELVPTQPPARPPIEFRQPTPAAQWRENEKELRLRGTKCLECGTPQYPPQRVCINCGTKDKMELYSFADKKAKLFSFSHDYVMQTVDSPVTITIVDFEGGGRIMCDMTDRNPDDIKVGMPVEMTFRRLYYVGGIHNYWWKCRPVRC